MAKLERDEHEPAPMGTYCPDCLTPVWLWYEGMVMADGFLGTVTVIDLRTNEEHRCQD